MPFLTNESAALKRKLEGIRVHTPTGPSEGTEVPVYFIGPQAELANASYPGIYIRYGPLLPATNRQMSGDILLPYSPEGFTGRVEVPVDLDDPDNHNTELWLVPGALGDVNASPYKVQDAPRAYDMHFDINVLTRSNQEAAELFGILATAPYLPSGLNGYLDIPEDGTLRTLELLGGPEIRYSLDFDEKRVMEILYSVSVAAELNLYQIDQIHRVETVDIDVAQWVPPNPPS